MPPGDEEEDDERNGEGDELAYHRLGREQHPSDPFRGIETEQQTGEDAGDQVKDEFHGESRCWCLCCD